MPVPPKERWQCVKENDGIWFEETGFYSGSTPHPGGMQIKAESTNDAERHKITNKPGGKRELFVKEQASSYYTEIECKIAGKDT